MALLGQSAFLKALGWALVNSIWQMGLLWMIFLVMTACMRNLTARMKHSLAVILLGTGFAWFAITLTLQYLNFSESPSLVMVAADASSNNNFADFLGLSIRTLENSLPYFSLVYLGMTMFLFFRFTSQYRYTRYVSMHQVHKPKPDVRIYVQQIAERMGIKKNIQVWISEIVDTPMTIGFWKPIILMPIASINGLSTQQVEAILLHELSHIKRNDYFVNLLITSIDIILFFNPFSRLFVRSIRKEREHSCDDLVLQFEYNAHAYASALLSIEQKRVMKLSLAMAATGKNNQVLLERVKRILNQPHSNHYNNRLLAHVFAVIMIGFIAWSNPGNVIVREFLKIEGTPLVSVPDNELIRTVSFNDAPKIKITPTVKKKPLKKEEITTAEEMEIVEKDLLTAFASYSQDAESINALQATQIYQAAAESKLRDFSIAAPGTDEAVIPENFTYTTPFVPSTSFSYYVLDSTRPNTVIATQEDVRANATLEKALRAVDEINWKEIQEKVKLNGEKVDLNKLQAEIKKSLKDLDWQRIDAETKLENLQQQSKLKEVQVYNELLNNAKKNNGQMGEHFKNLQKKIIEDQLKCQEETKKKEEELKTYLKRKNVKQKKIVSI